MCGNKFAPVHPGEILLEEFLKPMGISQYKLAKDISVHPRRINEIVHGQRSISADTALRLSRYLPLGALLAESSGALRSGDGEGQAWGVTKDEVYGGKYAETVDCIRP